jgi:lipoxygenase
MQMPFCPKLWSSAAPAPAQPGSVVINGTVVVANHFGLSAPGKSTTLRLFSGTEVDHGE